MWSLVLVFIVSCICVFFIILFDAVQSWTEKWLLTLLHTWEHNREIQWVTKGTPYCSGRGTLWVQVLSLFPKLQSFMYCCHNYCYIYTSSSLLPLHWVPHFKIYFWKKHHISWKPTLFAIKKVTRNINSIKQSSIMKF